MYEIKEIIGKGNHPNWPFVGGFGVVRKIYHKDLERFRAMKQIEKSKFLKDKSVLLNEINLLKKMDHPNIVKIYEFFEDDKYLNIITEYDSMLTRQYIGTAKEENCLTIWSLKGILPKTRQLKLWSKFYLLFNSVTPSTSYIETSNLRTFFLIRPIKMTWLSKSSTLELHVNTILKKKSSLKELGP
jgi:hypothetical protein